MSTNQFNRASDKNVVVDAGIADIGTDNKITAKLPSQTLLLSITASIEEAFDSGTTNTLTVDDGTTTFVNGIDGRVDDLLDDVVVSGLLSPTSGTLASTLSAGSAYVGEVYTSKNATAHTYTASKDTYVDLSPDGTLTYHEVANTAEAPATTAGALRLEKVVTDGTTVTAVTRKASLVRSNVANTPKFYPDGGELAITLAETGTPATTGRALVVARYVQMGDGEDIYG